MKRNRLGIPIFTGKVCDDLQENEVISIEINVCAWLTFKNDLSSIFITEDKPIIEINGFYIEDSVKSFAHLCLSAIITIYNDLTTERLSFHSMAAIAIYSKDVCEDSLFLKCVKYDLETAV